MSNVALSSHLTYCQVVARCWPTFHVLGDDGSQGMHCEFHAVVPHGASLGWYRVVSEQTVAGQGEYRRWRSNSSGRTDERRPDPQAPSSHSRA